MKHTWSSEDLNKKDFIRRQPWFQDGKLCVSTTPTQRLVDIFFSAEIERLTEIHIEFEGALNNQTILKRRTRLEESRLDFKGSYKPIGIQTAQHRRENGYQWTKTRNWNANPHKCGKNTWHGKNISFIKFMKQTEAQRTDMGPYFTPYAKINQR